VSLKADQKVAQSDCKEQNSVLGSAKKKEKKKSLFSTKKLTVKKSPVSEMHDLTDLGT